MWLGRGLVNVEHPLLTFATGVSLRDGVDQPAGAGRILPACKESTEIEVPRFDQDAKVDTSILMLGVATTLSRLDNSLPELSRWLAGTNAWLVVLLLDHPSQEAVTPVQMRAAKLRMNLIFEPYLGSTEDTAGLKNFALSDVLYKNKGPETHWFGIIDDDTFFLSLPRMIEALAPYDPTLLWYIGGLTEGLFRIAKEGFKAWGGAGFFISPPLMKLLSENSRSCKSLDEGFGDLLWRDCILEVTSPTVKLTQMPGLNQIDLWGDISGFYESGLNPLLTVHHWKSWHFHPIPMAHLVTDVAGPDVFLQRYTFHNNTVMTNGFSIVEYPNGLPDLQLAELTVVEDVDLLRPPGRLEFHHSLGRTRPPLRLGKDKISWKFEASVVAADGTIRQFYVQRAQKHVAGSVDSVIEIDWRGA